MFVIDCSAVVDLLVAEDAERVQASVGSHELHAPAHLDIEALSALRGMVLGRLVSHSRVRDAVTDLYDLTVQRWPLDRASAVETLGLASNVTAYDAAYVVLAQALGCPLLTRDLRLARAVEGSVTVVTV